MGAAKKEETTETEAGEKIAFAYLAAWQRANELAKVMRDLLVVTSPSADVSELDAERLGDEYGLENGPWSDIVQAVRDQASALVMKGVR